MTDLQFLELAQSVSNKRGQKFNMDQPSKYGKDFKISIDFCGTYFCADSLENCILKLRLFCSERWLNYLEEDINSHLAEKSGTEL